MDENYLALYEAIINLTYSDYWYLIRGKIPTTYPHIGRKKYVDNFIRHEIDKIRAMSTNGVCDWYLIDRVVFDKQLRRIENGELDGRYEPLQRKV